jgi:hypothetical protein
MNKISECSICNKSNLCYEVNGETMCLLIKIFGKSNE